MPDSSRNRPGCTVPGRGGQYGVAHNQIRSLKFTSTLSFRRQVKLAAQRKAKTPEQLRGSIQGEALLKVLQDHVVNGVDTPHTRLEYAWRLLSLVVPKPAETQVQTGELTIRWKS